MLWFLWLLMSALTKRLQFMHIYKLLYEFPCHQQSEIDKREVITPTNHENPDSQISRS